MSILCSLCRKVLFPIPPGLYLPNIKIQAQPPDEDLGNRKRNPGIVQPDLGKKPKNRNQAENLSGQRKQDAGARGTDRLEKDRHCQRQHRRQKLSPIIRNAAVPISITAALSENNPSKDAGMHSKHRTPTSINAMDAKTVYPMIFLQRA